MAATHVVVRSNGEPPPSALEWPRDTLDVGALLASGWRPVAFRDFVLKLHSRCNLACSYCYVYEMADQTWRTRPVSMASSTVVAAARRIKEHVVQHEVPSVGVVFHGGEPLLVGRDRLSEAADVLRSTIGPVAQVDLRLQTNGLLLTDDVLEVLAEHRVRVSVSLDGRAEDHDRRRHRAGGRGSHAEVVEALHRLGAPRFRELFAGLLCTIDLDNDPLATYDALLELAPPMVDFLLPHGNWTNPPPRREPGSRSTPYADWLLAIFDRWYTSPRVTGVRLFEDIISLALGGQSRTETIGVSPVGVIVVETDGSLEQVDALKSAYHGAAATGLNVVDHPFDRALDHPTIAARQMGLDGLADECRSCRARDVCGGGYYPHRYQAGVGYKRPSVYCPDLLRLTEHIRDRVQRDVRVLTT